MELKQIQQDRDGILAGTGGARANTPCAGGSGVTLYELDAVYEFRPLPDALTGPIRRYADGAWIADDGEYDIAFVSGWGPPCCLYFEPAYQRNIIGSWYDKSWGAYEPRHPRGNAWHYALRDGCSDWGGSWDGRDGHANSKAGRSGMNLLCGETGCANGRHVEPTRLNDPHVCAGLVRNRETKAVLVFPASPACMYCGDVHPFAPAGQQGSAA